MDKIKLKINGKTYSVGSEVSSDMKLVDYLRRTLNLQGTKYMCRAGGCGACTVSVVKKPGGKIESANSCLVAITSCHGWEITTIEHLGNASVGYHPIQKAMVEKFASQCGYCSPGWAMAMYSLINGKRDLTMLDIEKSLGSNICRCTGYRPIAEAFRCFGVDAPKSYDLMDIEDMTMCDKENCAESKCHINCKENEWCFVEDSDTVDSPFEIKIHLKDNKTWYTVRTVKDVLNLFKREGTASYRLVNGNTAIALFPSEYPSKLYDISKINELKGYNMDQNLGLGAGNSLTETIEIFNTVSEREEFTYLKKFNDHLDMVANKTVRNVGSIGGNLMMRHNHSTYTSDIFVLLETVGADLVIISMDSKQITVTLDEFLKLNMRGKMILKIILPPLNKQHHVLTFKVMPRAESAPAIVAAGFLFKLSNDNKVLNARMAYGGLSPSFRRAIKTEKFLRNKRLFINSTLQSAIKVLKDEMVVTEMGDFSVAYRKHLVVALFYKCLLILCPEHIIDDKYRSGAINLIATRPLSKSSQTFISDKSVWPVNQPIEKLESKIQCSGEAIYTDDIPSLPGEVFGVFVRSKVASGTIIKIDPSKALTQPGTIAFYSAKDIPGTNSFTSPSTVYFMAREEVFCSGTIKHYHQAIGILVAETQHIAETAAELVDVTYSEGAKPVVDVKDAKNDPKRLTSYLNHQATDRGLDIDRTITGSNTAYYQYHFPLETLSCVTRPSEDCLEVYTASQGMDAAHIVISEALNLDQHRIELFTRRLGGGYGIKISRSSQLAVAASLISMKLKKPCRIIQSLSTNLKAVGKRLPYTCDYEISVDKSGVIQEMNCKFYEDNGYIYNEVVSLFSMDIFNNCYNPARWNFQGYDTVTDTHSNTFCRAPGSLENIANMELIMNHIAHAQGVDPVDVRLANLDKKYGALAKMVNDLKTSADYANRRTLVEKYNAEHRWTKKGLSTAFVRWTPGSGLTSNATVSVYGDGTISITHGGIEMGQGMNTKAVQACSHFLNIPMDKFKVKRNDSIIAPNSEVTGGSMSTHNIIIALRRACEQLTERLKPFKDQLGDVSWEELIQAAYTANTNLQANGHVKFNESNTSFPALAVAFCETEVDILTGQREILRVDILQDVGRSINPAIDVGQVEGAFMMGVGYWMSEKVSINKESGEVLTDSITKYPVPLNRDTPQNFNVTLRENSFGPNEHLGSKPIGEPPACLSIAALLACREAVMSSRCDAGKHISEWIPPDGPGTVENLCMMAATSTEEYKYN